MSKTSTRPHIIGITGTIGSGKSFVGEILASTGIPVIDTDLIVHDLLSSDKTTIAAVIDRFGSSLRDSGGGIDRPGLAKIVFSDDQARQDLEAIVHPATILRCRQLVRESESAVVAVLVPLLFEAGLESEYDEIWTVYTSEPVLRERLGKRDHLTALEVSKRLNAQLAQDEKTRRAKHVIDNSGTKKETQKQVASLLEKLNLTLPDNRL